MIAYKFLRAGRVGPFSELRWPAAGAWVSVGDDLAPCWRGIHACRTHDLPWWLNEELWEIELDAPVRFDEHKVVAPAGRLVSRVNAWTPGCAQAYAEACAWRAGDRAAQALARAGHAQAARKLAGCETLDRLLAVTRRVAMDLTDTRINLMIAGDGAFRALSGAPSTSAYIAAHAANRLDGAAGYAAERAWQSQWLVDRLGLRR
jgi:hypothetical protein